MIININGIQQRLPIVRIDGKDYFIMGGTYQRLHNETIINEQYTPSGGIDRQIVVTNRSRFKFTVLTPLDASYITYSQEGYSYAFGDLGSLHASAQKAPPNDYLEYYDISALENFTGTNTHDVYMKIDYEAPNGDDPGLWQVPVELWGTYA